MALAAARLLNDKKADDIMLIDITGKSSFADYLVIASGSSGRQAEAMADDIEELFAKEGIEPKTPHKCDSSQKRAMFCMAAA